MAAIAVGNYFKVKREAINKAISSYVPSDNRSQILKKGSNTILLDAYNANPSSMKAALESFAEGDTNSKKIILGDMLELGNESRHEHDQIIRLCKGLSFKEVLLVGTLFSSSKESPEFLRFPDAAEAEAWLKSHPASNYSILIKGSRGIQLEKLVDSV